METAVTRETMEMLVTRKLAMYRNSIYDQTIELRVMERVKDVDAVKRIKSELVKFETIVDELEKVLDELKKVEETNNAAT